MLLGNDAIREAIRAGHIVCDPMPAIIEGTHIDVTLGSFYWLANDSPWPINIGEVDSASCYTGHSAPEDGAIELPPGRLVLAHTREFIGTTVPDLLPMMHGRSTLARWGVQVHLSAGWGDPGYASRWTMEIVNHRKHALYLPVGARVACIAFMSVLGNTSLYTRPYNAPSEDWHPRSMLPKAVKADRP